MKDYKIYMRSSKQWVPVTEKQFKDYYRVTDSFRRKQQRHGLCICPKACSWICDTDCFNCRYQLSNGTLSLEYTYENENGDECKMENCISGNEPDLADLYSDTQELSLLLSRLCDLMPEALEIGRLREAGLPDTEIAKRIGIARKTIAYRLKKAKHLLEKEFPEIL